jgi:hypothetical protein
MNRKYLILGLLACAVAVVAVGPAAAESDSYANLTDGPATVENVTYGEDEINATLEFSTNGSVTVSATAISSGEQKIDLDDGTWQNSTISSGTQLNSVSASVNSTEMSNANGTVYRTVTVVPDNPFSDISGTVEQAATVDVNVTVSGDTSSIKSSSLSVDKGGGMLFGIFDGEGDTGILVLLGLVAVGAILVLRD